MRLFDCPEHNMDNTRNCCGVRLATRRAAAASSGLTLAPRALDTDAASGALHTPPCRMVRNASMIVETDADLAMNADAPWVRVRCAMSWSSRPEITTTGTEG